MPECSLSHNACNEHLPEPNDEKDLFQTANGLFTIGFRLSISFLVQAVLHLYHFEVPGNGDRVKLKTALRYSDMAALKRTDIIGDTMHITTQKTHDRLPININKFSREIPDKYDGHTYVGNTALPVISNQKMNKYRYTR